MARMPDVVQRGEMEDHIGQLLRAHEGALRRPMSCA